MIRQIKPLLASLTAMAGIFALGLLLGTAAAADMPPVDPVVPQLTATLTPCPPPTPELLAVEPLSSPTLLREQTVMVRIGNGRRVTITSESGVAEATAVNGIAAVRVPLRPGTTHNLEVVAEVFATGGPGGCTYNYTLRTRTDRNGAPLRIVQRGYAAWLPLVIR